MKDSPTYEELLFESYRLQQGLKSKGIRIDMDLLSVEEILREVYEDTNSRMIRTMDRKVVLLLTLPPGKATKLTRNEGLQLYKAVDSLVSNAVTQQNGGVVEIRLDLPEGDFQEVSIISERNEMLFERALMVFESIEIKEDDWQEYLDVAGVSYKYAKDVLQQMGGLVGCVAEKNDRMKIQLQLYKRNAEKENLISGAKELLN